MANIARMEKIALRNTRKAIKAVRDTILSAKKEGMDVEYHEYSAKSNGIFYGGGYSGDHKEYSGAVGDMGKDAFTILNPKDESGNAMELEPIYYAHIQATDMYVSENKLCFRSYPID